MSDYSPPIRSQFNRLLMTQVFDIVVCRLLVRFDRSDVSRHCTVSLPVVRSRIALKTALLVAHDRAERALFNH